jgi:hypothetical protein
LCSCLQETGKKIKKNKNIKKSFAAGLKSNQAVPVLIPNVDLFDKFYNGCCNATFWPLFHSMPDRTVFDIETWQVTIDEQFVLFIDADPHQNYARQAPAPTSSLWLK